MPPQLAVEMTGDEVKLFKSLQKIVGQQKKMEDGFGRVQQKGKRAGDSIGRAVGKNALGAVKNFALGMVSISTATQLASAAMQHFQEATRKAMDQTKALAQSRAALVQIAGGDPNRLKALNERADAAAAAAGVDRAVAREVLFSAVSEGFEQGDTFEKILLARGVIPDPTTAATVAGQVPTLFQGQITPDQAINAVGVAAASSRLKFGQVAAALPGAAEGAAVNQGDAAETIATLSVLAGRKGGTGSEAATAISTFASKSFLDERTRGQGILEAVETVQGMSEADRAGFLGESKELNIAFTQLSQELPKIKERLQEVNQAIAQTGTQQSFLNQGINLATTDAESAAFFEAERERIAREIAETNLLSVRGNRVAAGKSRAMRQLAQTDELTAFDRFVGDKVGSTADFLGLSPGMVETVTTAAGTAPSSEQIALRAIQNLLGDLNQTQRESLEETKQQTNSNHATTADLDN